VKLKDADRGFTPPYYISISAGIIVRLKEGDGEEYQRGSWRLTMRKGDFFRCVIHGIDVIIAELAREI